MNTFNTNTGHKCVPDFDLICIISDIHALLINSLHYNRFHVFPFLSMVNTAVR